MICKPGSPTVVLELLATGDAPFIQAHIEKMPYYMELLSANEAWVVHFTCEDNYLDHPTWQSDKQLNDGINMMHVFHNPSFSSAIMSTRWLDADGRVQQIDKEVLSLTQ